MDTLNISFLCSPSKCRKNGYAPIEASITIGKKREYFQTGKYTRKAPATSRRDMEDMDFFTKELGI